MTSVAIGAVPDIVPDRRMVRVRLGLRVTNGALEYVVVGRIGMTRCAHVRGVSVVHRKPCVIE